MHRDIGTGDSPSTPIAGHEGRSVIAVIGINEYSNWPKLTNAVTDAVGIADLFTRLGFVEIVQPLLDADATGEAMRRLVTDDLAKLSSEDSLVLFFAGHGHTHTTTLGNTAIKTGYIVPVDATRPGGRVASWIRLDSWLSDVSRLPPRHILVIIDACHSGVALGSLVKWRSAVRPTGTLDELQRRLSRRIITSALDDQRALDTGPYPQHSLFTGCLIEGLEGGVATVAGTDRQYVTGSEIGLYVQNRVSTYPSSSQTPDFGALELDDRGELVVPIGPFVQRQHQRADPASVSARRDPPPRRKFQRLTRVLSFILGIAAASGIALVIGRSGSRPAIDGRQSLASGTEPATPASDAGTGVTSQASVEGAQPHRQGPASGTESAAPASDAGTDATSQASMDRTQPRHALDRVDHGTHGYADYAAACGIGNVIGCENSVYVLFQRGVKGTKELYRLATACGENEPACVANALITRDHQFAMRACIAGVPTACLVASALAGPGPEQGTDLQRVLPLIVNDMVDARFLRGVLLAFGLGVQRESRAASQLISQGCKMGDAASCRLLNCLNFDDDAQKRMEGLDACRATQALPEFLDKLAREALVHEVLQH